MWAKFQIFRYCFPQAIGRESGYSRDGEFASGTHCRLTSKQFPLFFIQLR